MIEDGGDDDEDGAMHDDDEDGDCDGIDEDDGYDEDGPLWQAGGS